MDTTTAPAQPASAVPSPEPSFQPGSEEAFQSLVDNGLLGDEAPRAPAPWEPEEEWSAEDARKQPPETPKQAAEGEEKPDGDQKAEGKQYASLDEYLKEAELEPESFMQLPVTVKVDGVEKAVPIAELQKSYQLSSAAYNRMNELAQERTSFQSEQTQVRQALGQRIQDTEALFTLAQQQLLSDFQAINWQQLEAENPGHAALLYQRFQAKQGAIQQHLQQIQATRQQETQRAQAARDAAFPAEWQKLVAVYPEMGDAVKGQEARGRIFAYAKEVGIPEDQVAGLLSKQNFSAAYVRALLDAAAYAKLRSQAPATVNRVRTAPQMAKPGTREVRDPKAVASQQAYERWAKSGFRDNDAGAAVFEQFA